MQNNLLAPSIIIINANIIYCQSLAAIAFVIIMEYLRGYALFMNPFKLSMTCKNVIM